MGSGAASALIVVDMQKDLCWDDRRADKVREALPHIADLIDAFAGRGAPVVYGCFALAPDDEQFRRFGDRYCVEGTPGADLIDELFPLRGPVMNRRKHSVFFETELDKMLRDEAVEAVYFAGLQTQICIMTSAADASFRGYDAIAVRECVVSTRDDKKDQALDWIAEYVGRVVTVHDAVAAVREA